MATFITELTYVKNESRLFEKQFLEYGCKASSIDVFERLLLTHRVSSYNGSPILNLELLAECNLSWLKIQEGDDKDLADIKVISLDRLARNFYYSERTLPFYTFEAVEAHNFTNSPEVKKVLSSYFL